MNEERKEEQSGNEEGGVSIKEIFRIIGKKIWYVLAGTLAVTLAAVLIFMFAINPAKQSKSMDFEINYPASAEEKYPDGAAFNYRDIVSRGVIENAKKKDEKFASIDVDKLYKDKDGITISASRKSENENYVYTISLKTSYFSGVDMEDFILQIGESFKDFIKGKAQDLDFKINSFEDTSYRNQLDLLKSKKEALVKEYGKWIKKYGEGRIVNGKSFGDLLNDVTTAFDDNAFSFIENTITVSGYEYFNKDVTAKAIQDRIDFLNAEKRLLIKKLEKLNGTNTASGYAVVKQQGEDEEGNTIIIMPPEDSSQAIAERLAVIETQLDVLTDDEATVAQIAEYGENNLTPYFNALNAQAETLKQVISSLYGSDTVLTFDTKNFRKEGDTSIVIVGVAVFVVSFLVLSVVAYFVGKKSAKAKKSESHSDKPLEGGENEKSE
ncbi:MAG: hypothetical protein K2L02_01960 [Clostridia bacterium]|nr:hypothetical protein [Clostridia bacterium]